MIVAYCCRTFIKLSAEPLPTNTMSSALQKTIAPLSPETFTHNTAIIPIISACTKASLIDGLACYVKLAESVRVAACSSFISHSVVDGVSLITQQSTQRHQTYCLDTRFISHLFSLSLAARSHWHCSAEAEPINISLPTRRDSTTTVLSVSRVIRDDFDTKS